MKKIEKIHPAIYDLKVDMDKGKITRRQFLRYATLLGMSAVTASHCGPETWRRIKIRHAGSGNGRSGDIFMDPEIHRFPPYGRVPGRDRAG
jgi:peptide/nickel transport system substrate-binding protein